MLCKRAVCAPRWRRRCIWTRQHSASCHCPPKRGARVCAVALTTQGETLLCVDRQGKALRPPIVWLDSRAEAQAARLPPR